MDSKLKTGIIVGVCVTIILGGIRASADYVTKFAGSDYPPLKGKAESSNDLQTIVTRILEIDFQRQKDVNENALKAAWAMVCAAKYKHDIQGALGQQLQIYTLQAKHIELTKTTFPLGDCP